MRLAHGASSPHRAEKVRTLRPSGVCESRRVPLRAPVAKKVRTPPPPRRVQAPQKRATRRAAGIPQRSPWIYALAGAAAVALIAAAVIGFIFLRDNGGGKKNRTPLTNYNALPGIRKTKAPWPPEYEFLADRLPALGLSTLPQEAVATHYHSHLDVYVDGKHITVPKWIGINPGANYITELHTHDTRGVIHVESPETNDSFTVGQLVAEWGVFLNGRCMGAYCNGLTWYVNGKRQVGNPQNYVMRSHDEIAIVVGNPPAKIPSSYKFLGGE
jgi:hypothetical protein